MAPDNRDDVRDRLRRPMDPQEYEKIRRLWIAHSVAEDRHDIPGLLETLTADCRYTIPQQNRSWTGHEGARAFYTALLTAFPDINFELEHIVIGPQGVWEEAHVTGTHEEDWLTWLATGRITEFDVSIYFPWSPAEEKFEGERVHYFGVDDSGTLTA